MNTAEMWLQAQIDGKVYEVLDGDIAYSKDMGLVDKYDFNESWELGAFDYCKNKNLDELLSSEWEEMENVYTIEEAEEKFGIKIRR